MYCFCEVISKCVVPHRPEGREDLLQHLQQGLLPTGGDVVLGQLEERKAVFALAPHVLQTQPEYTSVQLISHKCPFFYHYLDT